MEAAAVFLTVTSAEKIGESERELLRSHFPHQAESIWTNITLHAICDF